MQRLCSPGVSSALVLGRQPAVTRTVIPKSAIKRYLNAPRDDHRWLKKLTHREVDRLLSELRPRPYIPQNMGLHQKVGIYLGLKYGSFAFFYDMGTGKTWLSLELLQYFWEIGALRRALVFVISDKAFPTWERQHRQYKIGIPYCTLDSTSSVGKWKTLRNFGDGIIFLHYPGTTAMVSVPGKTKRGKSVRVLDDAKVKKLLRDVDVVVYDESTKASNKDSLTYKICRKASKAAAHRFALAGMPFGRDPTPLWAQLNLVDQGETLGGTLELFRSAFFNEKDNYWSDNPYSKVYKFRNSMRPVLSEVIQHNSLTYTAEECIDLPQARSIVERVKLPPETKTYYQDIVDEVIAAKGNMKAMKNAFHRMRQLSSGFLGLKDDETGERSEIEFDSNPKLELLIDLLDGLAEGRKALVYYQYTVSGRRIAKALKEEFGVKPVWLWSGTKNPREEMRRFMEADNTPFAVVNNQLGAYSLDGLQVANYEFFFESPVSVIDREQAKRRILRQGQQRKCFFYDLVVEDTVDERILEFHQEGRDLFKALLTNPEKMLRGKRSS